MSNLAQKIDQSFKRLLDNHLNTMSIEVAQYTRITAAYESHRDQLIATIAKKTNTTTPELIPLVIYETLTGFIYNNRNPNKGRHYEPPHENSPTGAGLIC